MPNTAATASAATTTRPAIHLFIVPLRKRAAPFASYPMRCRQAREPVKERQNEGYGVARRMHAGTVGDQHRRLVAEPLRRLAIRQDVSTCAAPRRVLVRLP